MATIVFRFLEPDSVVGTLISWWLREPWSHVVIIIDDKAYSAEVPFVTIFPLDAKDVSPDYRKHQDFTLHCTQREADQIKEWCESQVGILYDIASIVGWILGLNWLQSKRRSYCFEFCRRPLVLLGWLEPSDRLIKGNQLLQELEDIANHRLS